MTRDEALKLRAIVEQAAASLDDKTASEGVQLFPRLRCDKAQTADTPPVQAGTRVNWNGIVKKAKVTLWDTEANNPDNAPTLWEDIGYRAGIRIAPEVFTSTNAASYGELLWFGDNVFKSLKDGNTHTPAQAPEVWELAN